MRIITQILYVRWNHLYRLASKPDLRRTSATQYIYILGPDVEPRGCET